MVVDLSPTGEGSNYVLSFILMSVQWTSFESTIPIPKLVHCICNTRMKLSLNNSFVIKSNTCFIPTEMRIRFCAYIKSCKLLFCSSRFWKCFGNCCSLGTCCYLPISQFTDKSFLLVPGNDVLLLPSAVILPPIAICHRKRLQLLQQYLET